MEIRITDGLLAGRGEEAGLRLDDGSVSRSHARFLREDRTWIVEDLASRGGTYLNGHLFQREILAAGDTLGIGPFTLRFDGRLLVSAERIGGASLVAADLVTTRSGHRLLDGVSLSVSPGQFLGILGPSGAGKSTLLDALCGLRPPDSGTVTSDGIDLLHSGGAASENLGYVPQDDIVPAELAVRQALFYSALLRLPRGTPRDQAAVLAEKTARQVGLSSRLDTKVAHLSGGQRKRVSVAAELLGHPRLLFLDEPTSGLDPASELRMMETLRELASGSCTVLCTTHVVANAHLCDSLAVMCAGRLAYLGPPDEAPAHFGVESLAQIYSALESTSPPKNRFPSRVRSVVRPIRPAKKRTRALPVLMERQMAGLVSNRKNTLLLVGQPALIALLVAWVSTDPGLQLFFAYVATLWFGCGNAAQEIIRELPMFRRERLIGLGRSPYLFSKFLVLAFVTCLQALLLYGVLFALSGGVGWQAVCWQLAALTGSAGASVAIGLAISSWARSALQAVMVVPLILIPQILFSGFVVPAGEMRQAPFLVSRAMPSAAAQEIMDVSLFWGTTITGALRVDYPATFSNLNRDRSLKNGMVFLNASPAIRGLIVLGCWTVAGLLATWFFLRSRERG